MFTLYRIVEGTVTKMYRIGFLFTQETLLSEQFCSGAGPAGLICSAFQNYTYSSTQWSTRCCSHCAGTISATLHFTVQYDVNLAQDILNLPGVSFDLSYRPVFDVVMHGHNNWSIMADILKNRYNFLNWFEAL